MLPVLYNKKPGYKCSWFGWRLTSRREQLKAHSARTHSTVVSTVFARSLSGQLEDLVSQRSDCLWLERVARRSDKTCYKPVKAPFSLVYYGNY